MHNIPQKRFALLCVLSLSSISFWSDTSASSSASSASAPASSNSAQPVVAATAGSSGSASTAQQPIAAAVGPINVVFCIPRASKESAIRSITMDLGYLTRNKTNIGQLYNKHFAEETRLNYEHWKMTRALALHPGDTRLQSQIDQNNRDSIAHQRSFHERRHFLMGKKIKNWQESQDIMDSRGCLISNVASFVVAQYEEEKVQWQQREKKLIAENLQLRELLKAPQAKAKKKKHVGCRSCKSLSV